MENPRELTPVEMLEVADRLASVATEAAIDAESTALKVGVRMKDLTLTGDSAKVWLGIVRAVHAGASQEAGFRSDAVARLVQTVGTCVPGNRSMAELAYELGCGLAIHPGSTGVFLSYASADRSDVDRLYEALLQEDPQIAVFQDHRSLAAGQDWLTTLRERAGSSALAVCWVTSSFLEASFTHYEVGVADSRGAAIVPIFADSGISQAVPAYLSRRQGLTAEGGPDFSALAKNILTVLRTRPATPPLASPLLASSQPVPLSQPAPDRDPHPLPRTATEAYLARAAEAAATSEIFANEKRLAPTTRMAQGRRAPDTAHKLLRDFLGRMIRDWDLVRLTALLALCGLSLWLFPSPKTAFVAGLITVCSLFILPLARASVKRSYFERFVKNVILSATATIFVLIVLLVVTEQFPGGEKRLKSWFSELGFVSTQVSPRSPRRPSILVLPFSGSSEERKGPARPSIPDPVSTRLAMRLDQDSRDQESFLRVLPEHHSQLVLETLPQAKSACLRRDLLEQVRMFSGADFVVHGHYGPNTASEGLAICIQPTSDLNAFDEITIEGKNLSAAITPAAERIRTYVGIPRPNGSSPEVEDVSPLATRYYLQGLRSRNRFKLNEAAELFALASEEAPDFLPARSALARSWYELGRDADARSEARNILADLDSNPPTNQQLRHAMLARADAHAILHRWKHAIPAYAQLAGLYRDYVEYSILLIEALASSGNSEEARKEIARLDESEASGEILVSPIERVLLEIERAKTWLSTGNFAEQYHAARKASSLASRMTDGLLLARAQFFECAALVYLGKDWTPRCGDVESRFAELGDETSLGKVYGSIGNGLAHQGEYEEARQYYEKALAIFEELSFYRGQVDQLVNLSMTTEQEEGEYFCESAMAMARRYETVNAHATMLNCAYFPVMKRRFEDAKQLYREALHGFRETGADLDEAIALGNIGYMNHALGLKDEALDYYLKSVALSCDLGELDSERIQELTENGFAETLIRFSRLYADLEKTDAGRKIFRVGLLLLPEGERQSWLDGLLADIDYVLLPSAGGIWNEIVSEPTDTPEREDANDLVSFCETLPPPTI